MSSIKRCDLCKKDINKDAHDPLIEFIIYADKKGILEFHASCFKKQSKTKLFELVDENDYVFVPDP